MAFNMGDYVDVAERIAEFAAKHPQGSLQSELTPLEREGQLVGWLCKAYAYRSPTDERPGVGHAVEPVPGKTPYTRDSEAMNAETSAWGRAIIALGFKTKKIASANEVHARAAQGNAGTAAAEREAPTRASAAAPALISDAQRKRLFAIGKKSGIDDPSLQDILVRHTGQASTAKIPKDKYEAICVEVEAWAAEKELAAAFPGSVPLDDIPFQ